MNINDIEEKKDNVLKTYLIEKLGIPSNEILKAVEINTIVEAVKKKEDTDHDLDIEGDPFEEYLSTLNE